MAKRSAVFTSGPPCLAAVIAVFFVAAAPSPRTVAQEMPGLVITDVTLIDGTGRPPIEHAVVVVCGEQITFVGRGDAADTVALRKIDGSGKFLIPGLMDLHVHLSGGRTRNGPDRDAGIRAFHGFLYSGLTTIFDAGNNAEYIFKLRKEERAGELVAPRIFATGPLVTVPGGHGGGPGMTLSFASDRRCLAWTSSGTRTG